MRMRVGGSPADAKASAAGQGGKEEEVCLQPLSPEVVTTLLAGRYAAKYARLGLAELNPLRRQLQQMQALALAQAQHLEDD